MLLPPRVLMFLRPLSGLRMGMGLKAVGKKPFPCFGEELMQADEGRYRD